MFAHRPPHHLRLVDWRVLAHGDGARHQLSDSIRRVGEQVGMFLYRGSDTHVLLGVGDGHCGAIEAGRRIAIGLHRSLQLPMPIVTRSKPIADQRHL